jgi:hypothetical protein
LRLEELNKEKHPDCMLYVVLVCTWWQEGHYSRESCPTQSLHQISPSPFLHVLNNSISLCSTLPAVAMLLDRPQVESLFVVAGVGSL